MKECCDVLCHNYVELDSIQIWPHSNQIQIHWIRAGSTKFSGYLAGWIWIRCTPSHLSRGSHRHGSCYREVMGMFWGFKPSRHVKMVWKIPVTNWQPASCQGNGEIIDHHDKTRESWRRCGQINGDVTGLSRTCQCHGEVYSVSPKKSHSLTTCGNFSKTVGNFSTKFDMPITYSYLC